MKEARCQIPLSLALLNSYCRQTKHHITFIDVIRATPTCIYSFDDDDLLNTQLLLLRFLPPLLFAKKWKWVHNITYATTCVDGNIVIAVYAQK